MSKLIVRTGITLILGLFLFLTPGCTAGKKGSPPNFIIILTDDQGYHDLGCYGSTRVKTPNLDRMAAEGMRFTDFYAQNVCGPSRAALMSGCYPIRVGEPGNVKHQHTILHPEEITLAEKLKEAGYATACIGKWHLGLMDREAAGGWDPATMPNAQGFDFFYGTPLFNGYTVHVDDTPFRSQLLRNGEVVRDRIESWDFCTENYTNEAIRWIKQHRDVPFFLYLAHNMPHIPLGAGERFKGRNPGDPYADAVEEIDWSTGEIFGCLKETGMDRNTIVFFFSDNGPWIETTHGNQPGGESFIPPGHSGEADPLRGYKMLSWDGGHRVPCIAWAPGFIPDGVLVDELVTSMDLYPTLEHLSGAGPDTAIRRDGKDITGLLQDPAASKDPERVYYYYVYTHLQAVRQGPWKLVLPRPEFPEWTGFCGRFYGDGVEDIELYNLEEDIGETRDLAGQYPEVCDRLMDLVETARARLGDYNRIGSEARFFEGSERRPEAKKWP
jgi:arylsulfatase A-like enzyme